MKTFSGSVIEPAFDLLDVFWGNSIEVKPFRIVPSNQAVGVFNERLFPASVWGTKVGAKSESVVNFLMERIFFSVVVGH